MKTAQVHIAATSMTALMLGLLSAMPVAADPFHFSTGTVTNSIATASRPGPTSGPNQETESADDFFPTGPIRLNSATFTGLLPAGASVSQVVVEIYRVFPNDSNITRTPNVPTRMNSPSDNEFEDRNSSVAGELNFTTTPLSDFTGAQNSVDTAVGVGGGSPPVPVTGLQEERFNVTFTDPIDLPADHYFFVPQVLLSNADQHFLWLSASRPIDATMGGTPFTPDLQSWMRNAQLDPDWLRIGQDIVGGSPFPTFNAAFSLDGVTVPEPASSSLLGAALAGMGFLGWRRGRRNQSSARTFT
jgi:hypothetical protein